jgi:hypothetical protein
MNLLNENKAYMAEWEKKGHEDWLKNHQVTETRLKKEKDLDKFLTMRYVNKIQEETKRTSDALIVDVDEFTSNMQRMGIEDGPVLERLNRPPSGRGLAGFSSAATMNKIKESKRHQDFI